MFRFLVLIAVLLSLWLEKDALTCNNTEAVPDSPIVKCLP